MTRYIDMDKAQYTSLFKCTRCGQCTYGKEAAEFTVLCPVHKKGHFFSYSAGGMMQIARNLYEGKIDYSNTLKDIAYLCTTCGVCEVNCGVIENHLEIVGKIRKHLLEQDCPESKALSQVVNLIAEHKNPYGQPHAERTAWLQKKTERIENPSAGVFYYTGCVSAYNQKQVPKALDGIFSKLNIDYTVSKDEQCCGGPLFFAGLIDQARTLAQHNISMIEKTGIDTVVASCPTCALMFKKYYPEWTGKPLPFKVLHTMEYLSDLLEQNILNLGALKHSESLIYHDSCHLGRGLGIYEAPRKLLNAIENVKVEEFNLNEENSLCCGGGGMIPVLNPEFSYDTSQERLDFLKDKKGADISRLVSACPNCRKTLGLAAKKEKTGIKVNDVCELILEAME